MSELLMPVNFKVISIKSGDNNMFANIEVKFNDSDKTYNYYRKWNIMDGGGLNYRYVIVDGCRIVFDGKWEVVSVSREYNTAGVKRKSTEGQAKKYRKRRTKSGNSFPEEVPSEEVKTEVEAEKPKSNATEDVEYVEDLDSVEVDFSFEEEQEWERIEEEEKAKEQEKKELEELEGEIHHEKYDMIKQCLMCDIPVYLAGPAGSGKNHTVEQIANELGWDFYFSNSVQQEYKLTGFIDAGGEFHETEFYKACTSENECVFFLDEIDASIPDVLVLLNAAIANGYFEFPNGRVDFAHVHFVAAGNTVGSGADDMYTGRMVLDQATLDRFAIIEFDYSYLIERKVTKNNKELIEFIRDLRKVAKERGIRATFSYRCEIMVTKLEKAGMPLEDIMRIAVMKGLDQDTINTMRLWKAGTKYHEALSKIQV